MGRVRGQPLRWYVQVELGGAQGREGQRRQAEGREVSSEKGGRSEVGMHPRALPSGEAVIVGGIMFGLSRITLRIRRFRGPNPDHQSHCHRLDYGLAV